MHPFLLIVSLFVVISLFVSWVASRPRGHQLTPLCNVGEGFQPATRTYRTDAALAQRNLLMKRGSDVAHVAACGVGDIPLGIANDAPDAAEEPVGVRMLGLGMGEMGVASGAIALDAFVVAGAAGPVRTLPVAAGTYYIIGRCTKAAADTEPVEFTPCFPIQRVVP
jgi:hypothetical protein